MATRDLAVRVTPDRVAQRAVGDLYNGFRLPAAAPSPGAKNP
ncbi:hypothetical protein [Streptomyces sp. NPDC057681]